MKELFSTTCNKQQLSGMRVVKVTNIALQSELFLRAWHYGAGFAIRHYLPDYLSLCAATFPTMSLVHALILPMPYEDLKRVFYNLPLPDGSEY